MGEVKGSLPLGSKHRRKGRGRPLKYLAIVAGLSVLILFSYLYFQSPKPKSVILYVDQGNGAVGESNFGQMTSFASAHGFNTIFFQVYRQGALLFTKSDLSSFVNQAHTQGLEIFFALYFTNSTQAMPNSIMGLGEDGVSLDMSTLSTATQENLLATLTTSCGCKTAVTTTDMTSPLKPDLLILETYGPPDQQYIRPGTIGSVGVFATSSQEDYQSQFQYALNNSDGVMVFDYAGLLKSGY
jgi:xanthosine utilization system XapX-like protein